MHPSSPLLLAIVAAFFRGALLPIHFSPSSTLTNNPPVWRTTNTTQKKGSSAESPIKMLYNVLCPVCCFLSRFIHLNNANPASSIPPSHAISFSNRQFESEIIEAPQGRYRSRPTSRSGSVISESRNRELILSAQRLRPDQGALSSAPMPEAPARYKKAPSHSSRREENPIRPEMRGSRPGSRGSRLSYTGDLMGHWAPEETASVVCIFHLCHVFVTIA